MTDEQNDEVCDEARELCRNCEHADLCWDTCRAYEDKYEEIAKSKGYFDEGGAE